MDARQCRLHRRCLPLLDACISIAVGMPRRDTHCQSACLPCARATVVGILGGGVVVWLHGLYASDCEFE